MTKSSYAVLFLMSAMANVALLHQMGKISGFWVAVIPTLILIFMVTEDSLSPKSKIEPPDSN